ncbi:MAG: sortase [Candidatus Levybacteria bacterium]|nr:sortase [Candidatus Levybacteria bacterium]
MGKYYYAKSEGNKFKKYLRLISILFFLTGTSIIAYVLFPFISWQIYFQPVFASQGITYSIPRTNIVESSVITDLISQAKNSINRTDYTNAENWFPQFHPDSVNTFKNDIPEYIISIPKIGIKEATVSTVDNDLEKHLVNYQGTSIPGRNGNAVIFGHSTLPQLFNEKDYKTIFSNVYKLQNGDSIYAKINNVTYAYKIYKIVVVDPSDTSSLIQDYDNSYLTLVTCTPPGTIWKRLIVKSRLEKI